MLTGNLDFQRPIHSGGRVIYSRFEQPDRWVVLPHALDIGKRPDGLPDFQLDLVRAADAGREGYGVLDFRTIPVVDLEAGKKAVSAVGVEPGNFTGGWLRLLVREPGQTIASTLLPPLRIASNGLGVVRLSIHLSPEGATLLKRALIEGSVLVEAWAEMEIAGVAPRVPATVTVRSAELSKALLPAAAEGPDGLITRSAMVNALARPGMLIGAPGDLDRLAAADAVADRLLTRAGTLAPSPQKDFAEMWRVNLSDTDASFEWDLRQPSAATRMHVLRFDPVGLVRGAITTGGLDRLVSHRDLPDFQTGFVPLVVTANLPNVRTRVLSCGVDVIAGARPPHRLNVIRESIEFTAPADRQEVLLRFAADENPGFEYQTFVIVQLNSGIEEWRGPRTAHTGADLRLAPDQFAARFVPVVASRQLLGEGAVSITAQWNKGAQTIALGDWRDSDVLVLPKEALKVEYTCTLKKPGQELTSSVQDASQIVLDLPLFRGYGAHTVEIEVDFAGGPDLIAFEFKTQSEDDAKAVPLSFTVSKPRRAWTWFASSPFEPGYCYRIFQTDSPRPWSAPQSPFEPLKLRSAGGGSPKAADHSASAGG